MRLVGARFELKLQDLWVGVFWKRKRHTETLPLGDIDLHPAPEEWWDIWVCIVPCLPFHVTLTTKAKRR